jgi:hypothetical protein
LFRKICAIKIAKTTIFDRTERKAETVLEPMHLSTRRHLLPPVRTLEITRQP